MEKRDRIRTRPISPRAMTHPGSIRRSQCGLMRRVDFGCLTLLNTDWVSRACWRSTFRQMSRFMIG